MSYVPVFTGPIEGWTVNYCKRHMWRVERSMEWADLMQEAYIVFLRCCAKYPVIETPQHFMALYKMAWSNAMVDFAYEDTKLRALVPDASSVDDDVVGYEPVGELTHDGNLAILLRQAPREVLMVLNLFLSAPTEIVELALAGWRGKDKRCKTSGSKKICRMLGLPDDLDVLQLVEDYFQPQ